MPVATANAFLEVLERSRLVPPPQLEPLRDSLANLPDGKSAAVRLVKEGVLTRWQAGALLAGKSNLSVGKYQLLDQLATGKTGRVFIARHADMGRQVALKILPRRADASANNLEQFMAQARAVSSLDHPNLIHTYDVDSGADQFYLVMEYFPGTDLQTLVDKEGLPEFSRAADIVRQAAEGLAHAAERGMTHGDIRPNSFAVDRSGRVKVLHLGVVELAGVALRMLDTNDPATADYAAPEFTPGNATTLSDIYSLGCVLYFLLTGKPPFGEGTFAERRRQHQSVPPAAVTAVRADAPPELAKICQKMMAKKPENRLGSFQEVATSLAAWLAENPVPPRPAPASKRREPGAKETTAKTEPLPDVGKKPPAKRPPVAAPSPPREDSPPAPDVSSPAGAEAAPNLNFVFDKPPAKRKAAAPAPAQADAAPAAKPAKKDTTKNAAKKPLDRRLLIGLGVGGGVSLLAIVAAAALFMLGGDDAADQVAQTSANAVSETQSGESPDGLPEEEESLDGDLFSSSDGAADRAPVSEDPAPETTGDDLEAAPDAEPSNELAMAASAATADDASEGVEAQPPAPNVEPAPAEGPPAEASETSSAAPPAEAAPADSKADDPAADAPATESPPPAEAPKPAETPKKKPAPAKKPAEPFADFAKTAISLPPLEGDDAAAVQQPVALAKVHDDPEAGMFVNLVGGDTAYDGRDAIAIEADDINFRNRAWTVSVGGESKTPVAKFTLDEQDNLMFQWSPQSLEQKAANYLRNCMLNIQVGDKSKDVALREAVAAEPLTVSLSRSAARPPQIDIPYAPPDDLLQFEITGLDGAFPSHTFEPQKTIKAARDNLRILFGDPPTQLLVLQVQTTMSRGKLAVAMTPSLNSGGQLVRLKPGDLEKAALAAQSQYQQTNNLLTQKVGPAKVKEVREKMEQSLPLLQAAATQYADLAQKASQLGDSGKIHFRVFYTVGQHQVELLKTNGASAPGGEAAKR